MDQKTGTEHTRRCQGIIIHGMLTLCPSMHRIYHVLVLIRRIKLHSLSSGNQPLLPVSSVDHSTEAIYDSCLTYPMISHRPQPLLDPRLCVEVPDHEEGHEEQEDTAHDGPFNDVRFLW